VPVVIDNPTDEALAYNAAASGACERVQSAWAFESNQRLQKALRDGAEPDEAGFQVMAEMVAFRREQA
jgi:hypothetical protein